MLKSLVALVAALGFGFSHGEVGAIPPTPWDDFNALDFKMTSPQGHGYAAWRVRFDKESVDVQVDTETGDGKRTTTGRILVVGGRVMATQGPITEPGYEIDALDAPVLERQLVTQLLARALPGGPPVAATVRRIDFTDDKAGIRFATRSAQGFIPAPWHVQGEVKATGADAVEFTLALTVDRKSVPAGQAHALDATFTGRLSMAADARIDDATPLAGWTVLGLGVHARKAGRSTAVDYGAAPVAARYKTVADIRKEQAAEDFPGEPDRSKDFTGFWKSDCSEPFGLQIMPFGADGKYSIVFCGPDGCGKAGEDGRNTFITKDPHYSVVSEGEIRIRNGDGGWDAYARCTKETRPILETKVHTDR